MGDTTTRLALPYPEEADEAEVHLDMQALAEAIDLIMGAVYVGTYAERDALPDNVEARFFWQTDTAGGVNAGSLLFDTGSGWVNIAPVDGAAGVASLRTLGTTATSAAAGNDPRLAAGEKGLKAPVRAVHTSNVANLANPGTMTFGGVVCSAGDRVLLTGQSSSAQNGVYVVGASSSSALVRADDMAAGSKVAGGTFLAVSESSTASRVDSLWMVTTDDTDLVVGTDAQAWSMIGGADALLKGTGGTITGSVVFSQSLVFFASVLMSWSSLTAITGSTTLTNASETRQRYTGAGGHTITLPEASALGNRMFLLENHGTGSVTIARDATGTPDTITFDGTSGGTSIVLQPGMAAILHTAGSNAWEGYSLGSRRASDETITGAKTYSQRPRHGVNAITATATIAATAGKLNTFAGSSGQTVTLPAAVAGDELEILNIDTADSLTVQRAGTDTITPPTNGSTVNSFTLPAGGHVRLVCVTAGTWRVFQLNTPLVSALPSAPFDGMELRLQTASMLTDSAVFTVRYNVNDASGSYKWQYVSGSWRQSQDTDLTTHSGGGAYEALTGDTLSMTLPAAGDYTIRWGALAYAFVNGITVNVGVAFGGTVATDNDSVVNSPSSVGVQADAADIDRMKKFTGLSASTVVTLKYKTGAGSGASHFMRRHLEIVPVRIG